jgi:hypothetical protein
LGDVAGHGAHTARQSQSALERAHQRRDFVAVRQQVINEMTANKARAAGDEGPHGMSADFRLQSLDRITAPIPNF